MPKNSSHVATKAPVRQQKPNHQAQVSRDHSLGSGLVPQAIQEGQRNININEKQHKNEKNTKMRSRVGFLQFKGLYIINSCFKKKLDIFVGSGTLRVWNWVSHLRKVLCVPISLPGRKGLRKTPKQATSEEQGINTGICNWFHTRPSSTAGNLKVFVSGKRHR